MNNPSIRSLAGFGTVNRTTKTMLCASMVLVSGFGCSSGFISSGTPANLLGVGNNPRQIPGTNTGANAGTNTGNSSNGDTDILAQDAGLHRLSVLEYDNSIQDLTGSQLSLAGAFPPDGTILNFDNGAETATLSSSWIDLFVGGAMQLGEEITTSASDANTRRAKYLKVAPCASQTNTSSCLATTARTFGRKVWRRPLSESEVSALVKLASTDSNRLPQQIGTLVSALFSSPHFLFRVEADPANSPNVTHPITAYELASRMSYFLWRSTPDDTLLAAAEDGSLLTDEVIDAETDRMLQDPRAESLVSEFGMRWLYLNQFDASKPSPKNYPNFNENVRSSLRAETQRFLRDYILGGTPLKEIVTSRYTYLDDTAATYYGVTKPQSATPVRVELSATGPRHGILTQASVLIGGSTGVRTSPIRRGKLVIGQFLCSTPPPPPTGADALSTGSSKPNVVTNRQLLAEHTSNPLCAACHVGMDDFGFAFENFDGGGMVQATDNGQAVDTTGNYMGKERFSNSQQMATFLAKDPKLDPCFTKFLFTYAMGRSTASGDEPALKELSSRFSADQENVNHLIRSIVRSKSFRSRTGH